MTQRLATWMALWLLAISLAAPAHQLEHIGHDHDTHCDFFIHGQQLVTALPAAELPQALPTRALTASSPACLALVLPHRAHCAIRAPPLNS